MEPGGRLLKAASSGLFRGFCDLQMMGYDVYVDGAYVGKDGTNGDAMDGVFRFMVAGGQTHTIRVFDGVNNYEKPMYFERGVAKVINVPPATTVYASGGLY